VRDEVIDSAAHREVLAHADHCARCAHRLASERLLSDTLAAAIAEDAARQAPAHVSKMLLEGFRERKIADERRRHSWIRWGVTGAVAAMLLIGSAIMLRKSSEMPVVRGTVAAPVDDEAAGVADTGEEVATEFIPLSYDPAPAGTTSVVRVQLPREALTAFGLPVNEDRTEDLVQADLLVDEDGLTRAVRFVE
jgi:hypothetical protein